VEGHAERSTASFSTSISGTVPHCRVMTFFSWPRPAGSGSASSGESLMGPWLPGRGFTSSQGSGSASLSAASSARISSCSWPMNSDGSSGLRSAL
jgi:hypothetical protein